MLNYSVLLLGIISLSSYAFAENVSGTQQISPKYDLSKNKLTGMEFVLVPGGCFRMGSENGNSDEKPVHDVCVSGFYMGKYEVTQGQWLKVMGSNPSRFHGCGSNCPVEQISSNEAIDFTARLNNLTGLNYRLPTEAEWEYACRSGGKDEHFCGGSRVDDFAWIDTNGGGITHPVGRKKANGLGLYDMSGNVWEWVIDWKGDYPESHQQNPVGPPGSTRVRRGGSWQYGAGQSSSTWRSSGYPDDHALDIGFRVVLPVPG